MVISDTNEAIKILNSVNFIDSGLFGLTVDIFRLRILLSTPAYVTNGIFKV